MSTFLRSLKFTRRFSLQGRRLGSSSAITHVTNNTQLLRLSRLQCPILHEERTYITQSSFKTNANPQNNIDRLLDEIDHRVRNYQGIYKKHMDEILNAVTERGSLTSTQALLMIRCCGAFLAGEHPTVKNSLIDQIWDVIKELQVPIDVSHYNALLLVYLENERDFSPVDILLEMKKNKIEPNHVTFQRLIKQYCNKGDIPGATKILEHMSQTEIPINENIFNSLIKGHSEAGDMQSATKILSIMKNANIEPSSRTYAELLCAYAKKGDIDSIKSTFTECKEKNIQLADKEILDVIYTLSINQHLNITDEMISYLNKGGLYNKDAISYIYKLIDKNCLDMAYKLVKTLNKPENRQNYESGGFFLRKLVSSEKSPETLIKYCKLMKEEQLHNNPLELIIIYMFTHNKQHLALPVMKYWAETGAEIREHFFFPIFVAHSKDNNLQGLLNTAKTMVFDFKITPSVSTIKEYIVPFLIEDAQTNAKILVNNHLPYTSVANAILLHLLNQSKAQQAYEFISSTGLTYRLAMLVRPLVRALSDTKDVESIAGIVHHQYVMSEKNQNQSTEDKVTPREFSSSVVARVAIELPAYDTTLITKFLESLHEKGIGIDDRAVEQVQKQLGDKITAEIEGLLNALASDSLKPQNVERLANRRYQRNNRGANTPAEGTPEFTMLLIQQHIRNGEHELVEKLLPQLEQQNPSYTASFCSIMVDHFSKTDNTEEASKWFNKLTENFSDFKLDKTKILRYAGALVKNNKVEEALNILKYEAYDIEVNRNILVERLLNNVNVVCPDKLEEFIDLLVSQNLTSFVTSNMLSPLVREPLKQGDIAKAIEKFQWSCEKYKVTPCKTLIMSYLINQEDAKTLKHVTDLSTQVHGEMNSLIDLAVAFFETNRPLQARKILETPGLRLSRERVRAIVERYYTHDQGRLEGFIQLINGLFLNMDPFYVLLLKSYGKKDEWKKCLALWIQLQEDNIQPSVTFMEELERILRQCNQEIPFAPTNKVSLIDSDFNTALLNRNLEEAEKLLNERPSGRDRIKQSMKLAEAYLTSNNLDKAMFLLFNAADEDAAVIENHSQFIKNVIEKLVELDNFELISKLFSKFVSFKKIHNNTTIPYNKILVECYLKQGKYTEFLSHFEKAIAALHSHMNSIFHVTFNASLLIQHPEYVENVKCLALKALNHRNYRPMHSLWIYYFFKDDPEADTIFNTHLENGKFFSPLSTAFICEDNGAWSKLPKLSEKIATSQMHLAKKRKSAFSIIKRVMTSDDPKKYETAYDCLRHLTKIVPLDQFKDSYISELQANLPDNLSLDSIKLENDRVKTQATG